LHHLIEDLLDVSHLTLDAIEVRPALLDVTALLHDLITDQAARALARGLTLTAVPAPDRPTLTTDPNLLRQALGNVLNNALNYTPRGAAITLRTDRSSTPEGVMTDTIVDCRQDRGHGCARSQSATSCVQAGNLFQSDDKPIKPSQDSIVRANRRITIC
jgi:K+-sensing histidine kinase KdpD